MDNPFEEKTSIRVLCRNIVLIKNEVGLQWLIGSPFFPAVTIVSTFRCLHTLPSKVLSPNYLQEAEDLRTLLLRGFCLIGALISEKNPRLEENARDAIDASIRMRKLLYGDGGELGCQNLIGAVADSDSGKVCFYVSRSEDSTSIETVTSVLYDDQPEKYVWETGCLLRCELGFKLPFCFPVNHSTDPKEIFKCATESIIAKFKDSQVVYMVEILKRTQTPEKGSRPVIFRCSDLDFHRNLSKLELLSDKFGGSDAKSLTCSYFCSESKAVSSYNFVETADIIEVSLLLNRSGKPQTATAPTAEYFPALEEARVSVLEFKLDVLCYAAKDLPLKYAVSSLIIPGLIDQLTSMKKAVLPHLLVQHPQLCPYHFSPPGVLHPITAIYELSYGETEMKQVEVRRSLHIRLGLPLNRPLLRTVNALKFSTLENDRSSLIRKGSPLLKDVHIGLPSSGVSGGLVSLVQGSYEYYHYLQDGFDDSGWGCAYRSLQTIISWFRLQHYTSIDVPSHREIQQSLVEIGDKDPSFIGSREWIGAIELSFVLDKLLGVNCKVINVRSGAELPEKCRELALHFENQGTPIMIGGGVLAYTLLGVDYDEASGHCAFLILDPHYTGSDDLKKIINGGWCSWKKAVDSKGKNFFLHDKFYNLLLPQRPSMV